MFLCVECLCYMGDMVCISLSGGIASVYLFSAVRVPFPVSCVPSFLLLKGTSLVSALVIHLAAVS